MPKRVALVILDGFGERKERRGNAIALARTPNWDFLRQHYPNTLLKAAGQAVGLPAQQMGNSEVGHLNIGAGTVVYTGLSLINQALKTGHFQKNASFLKAFEKVKKTGGTLHLMGLLSPGGVHSHEEHLFELLKLTHSHGLKNVSVHVFGDGRDVSPQSIRPSLEKLTSLLSKYDYHLASIMGRVYAMDRDQRFEKTLLAYQALQGKIQHHFNDVFAYLDQQYQQGLSDEFLEPAVSDNVNTRFLKPGDAVIFFNFRPDRARQLSHFLVGSSLYSYKPSQRLTNIDLVSMMKYEGIDQASVAFTEMEINQTLGKTLAENHLKQLRVAETQKYAHVTFFFDGGKDVLYPLEKRILVPSHKVDNFAQLPGMSAQGITDEIIKNLDKFDVIIANYANPDMVGHTGELEPTIQAIEAIDDQLGQLYQACKSRGVTLWITADHGNAEIMLDQQGKPSTKHTSSDVPLVVCDSSVKLKSGKLADVSPSVLDYLGLKIPPQMDAKSLISKVKS